MKEHLSVRVEILSLRSRMTSEPLNDARVKSKP